MHGAAAVGQRRFLLRRLMGWCVRNYSPAGWRIAQNCASYFQVTSRHWLITCHRDINRVVAGRYRASDAYSLMVPTRPAGSSVLARLWSASPPRLIRLFQLSRAHRARGDTIDIDTGANHFQRHRSGEGNHPTLRGRVMRAVA